MIVLTLEPGEAEKLAEGAPDAAAPVRHADRPGALPAPCILGAGLPGGRRRAPARPAGRRPLLRRLRVRTMLGGLLDDPALLAAAAGDAGLDPGELERGAPAPRSQPRCRGHRGRALARRPPRARSTTSSAGPPGSAATRPRATRSGARQTARRPRSPAFIRSRPTRRRSPTSRPSCERRPKPDSVAERACVGGHPLATAEVAAIAQLDATQARVALAASPARGGRRRLLLVLEEQEPPGERRLLRRSVLRASGPAGAVPEYR